MSLSVRYHTLATIVALSLSLGGCTGIFESSETLSLELAEVRVPCMGVGPMECYLVRFDGAGDFELFSNGIIGFDFEPGYRYRLRVSRRDIENPPADGSSHEYRLRRVEARTPSPRADLLARVRDAEAKWQQTRPAAYTMVQERGCFCGVEARGPVRLEVSRIAGGAGIEYERVDDMRYVAGDVPVRSEFARLFFSMQDLFGYVYYAIVQAHRIEVEFAAADRPSRVYVDWKSGVADDEVDYIVRALVPR